MLQQQKLQTLQPYMTLLLKPQTQRLTQLLKKLMEKPLQLQLRLQ